MRQKLPWLTALCIGVIFIPSCARDQQLVSVAVQPTTETFGAANVPVSADKGLSVQLTALGTYIHPPVTKDITNQVTWASDTPGMVTVSPTGLITATGLECGNSLISATVTTNSSAGNRSSKGAIVSGTMTANVVCFGTGGGGSGAGPVLTVTFMGAGSGTVAVSPTGFVCTMTCSISFTSGTNVALTATPNSGSTFGNWANCDSGSSGQVCDVNNLTSNRTVTVTFN